MNKKKQRNELNRLLRNISLKTSHYGNIPDFDQRKTFLVSTSGGQLSKELKKTYREKGLDYFYAIDMNIGKEVGPSWKIFSKYKKSQKLDILKEFEYYNSYVDEILSNVDLTQLLLRILQQAEKEEKTEVVLLCYEKYDEFCHRFILAEKIRYVTGKQVLEKFFEYRKQKTIFGRLILD